MTAREIEDAVGRAHAWFSDLGWTPFEYQSTVWRRFLKGESGLVHSATGSGKTLAAILGPMLAKGAEDLQGLRVLWITPLRALSHDTERALREAASVFAPEWRVETRTGDTPSSVKAKQAKEMPQILVTTPESLNLLLSYPHSRSSLSAVDCVIVDEWHELMSSKRGVQTELALARLRMWNPDVRTWGLSATLGNLPEALTVLMGIGRKGSLVTGDVPKHIVIDTLLPESIERFPWAGHLGVKMLPQVIEAIESSCSCLVFTNTRSQTEIWHQAIVTARPDWKGVGETHHGSLDRGVRDAVELGIKSGRLRCVVCTSSLDLGVDFSPVDRVLQVGSPKGVARLLQRAGSSGHQPGSVSRITCVPTFALELIDISATRQGAIDGRIEKRASLSTPLDVLAQHCVTVALGGGFAKNELLAEVRTSHAYATLTDGEWQWTLDFVMRGGSSLKAYPEYHKVIEVDGVCRVDDRKIGLRHRLSIGTIVSDAAVQVQYVHGGQLGSVEESFASRLLAGDQFLFGGTILEFVRLREMTCWVRRAKKLKGAVPRWMGGRLPLSNELAQSLRERLDEAARGVFASPEMAKVKPLLEVQGRWSAIPKANELLIEEHQSREGHHLFIFPFEGRLVHEGLAALFAYRISRRQAITFSMAMNDYGFELLSNEKADVHDAVESGLFAKAGLLEDIPASLNAAEMARRQFREIARVAGLVFQGYPGSNKSARQIQASSGLFYDVFTKYDPTNLLLDQARREVLERQLEASRLVQSLERLSRSRILITAPSHPSPLAFPILVDRLRQTVSSERVGTRIERMALKLEREAG